MQQISNSLEVRKICDLQRSSGQRIGFVPTMGYLHDGHLSLMREASRRADFVVVSIFVNPTQFGPNEDLDRYPRDFLGDIAKCKEVGVDLLFIPDVKELYPHGFQTYVSVENISQKLCGKSRPGHFRGVCTVVAKFFSIIGPCTAIFGEKDYQQLQIIKQMASDLNFPIEVVGAPIVREPDGLAMSSRNVFLSSDERRAATCLYKALCNVRDAAKKKEITAPKAISLAKDVIQKEPSINIDYLEVCDRETLEPIDYVGRGGSVVALAVRLGKTRLIDNMII